MAVKKVTKNDGVEIVDVKAKKAETETKKDPIESAKKAVEENKEVKEEAKKPVKSKLVEIRMRDNHHCWIAKEHYTFQKGETYKVPENVKNILAKAGLLDPL